MNYQNRKPQSSYDLFLGSINYYARFIPSLQPKCTPLHRLLRKESRWNWNKSDSKLFQELKNQFFNIWLCGCPLSKWFTSSFDSWCSFDYTGPYNGKMWFVVIDTFSRWMDIFPMYTATSESSIKLWAHYFLVMDYLVLWCRIMHLYLHLKVLNNSQN